MCGWFCKRCHQPMKRVYTWFQHVKSSHEDRCSCQHAYYAEEE